MSVSTIFRELVNVSETLRGHFPNAPLNAQETVSQYNSSHDIPDVAWLDKYLPPLAETLLSALFRLTLKIDASGYKVDSSVQRDAAGRLILTDPEVDEYALSTESMSPEAQQTLNDFKTLFAKSSLEVDSMVQQATALAAHDVGLTLTLQLFLDKTALNKRLAGAGEFELTAQIVSFLFQDQLRLLLESTTVDEFETEFLHARKRTMFLVFDLNGGLASDFLTVCGRQQHDDVEALISGFLPAESLLRAERSHKFRQSTSFGNFKPKWLTPELLAVSAIRGLAQDSIALKRALQRFQPAVAAIFMADLVEADDQGIYSVEYRGLRPRRLQLGTEQLLAHEEHWGDLYELYQYAYDGFSADKLEIVQQFLSQFAEDVGTLCTNATEIREAAKKTHDRTLITKVQEYFEARQSIQERIQTAVAQLTTDIITLSREVSADVYRVMGVIALAIAGSFFKADIGLFALVLGFLTIAIYLLVVVIYHLPTLQLAADLRKRQNDAYINSFSDVLTAQEIQAFLDDINWREAVEMFSDKRRGTTAIYVTFCVISFLAAAAFSVIWLTTPVIPPVKIAFVL